MTSYVQNQGGFSWEGYWNLRIELGRGRKAGRRESSLCRSLVCGPIEKMFMEMGDEVRKESASTEASNQKSSTQPTVPEPTFMQVMAKSLLKTKPNPGMSSRCCIDLCPLFIASSMAALSARNSYRRRSVSISNSLLRNQLSPAVSKC